MRSFQGSQNKTVKITEINPVEDFLVVFFFSVTLSSMIASRYRILCKNA